MEPSEILSRVCDVGRHLWLYCSLQRVNRRAWRLSENSDCLLRAPQLDDLVVEKRVQDSVVASATQWAHRRASFFDLCDVPLGDRINWQRDHSTGMAAPMRYSGLINHRDATAVGDVKYIWELNRLQHLIPLALASVWTGKDIYKEEIARQTLSWIAENPFMMGVNWKSPLEAAIRLISWAFVFSVTGSKLSDLFNKQIRQAIYQHQYFISKLYSKHSSANNHLIGEMAGLYVGSVIWPFYKESPSWQSLAKQKLIGEAVRQLETDGVGKERATEYQLFILEFFVIAGALGQAIGDPFPPEFWQRLGRMITFLSAISDRNGNLPVFGDGDSGQVVGLSDTVPSRLRALVQLGDSRLKPTAYPVAADLRTLLLLWGQKSENIPMTFKLEHHRGDALRAFPQGGYYVLSADRGRDDEMVVVFDAGPLGLPPLYAHGHADALSFWLSYGGHEFFVDSGTFTYYTHDPWRAYFRSTAAHNTIRIDGHDQSIPGGRFLWSHVANCRLDHTEENDDMVEVEAFHDGYRRLADPVIHRRCMRLYKKSKKLLIRDTLNCADSHTIEVFFHFNENCQVEQTGPASFIAARENARLRITLDLQLKPELLRGSENPILGWVSRTYGLKEPSFTLVGRARLTGSSQLVTEIAPVLN
jgi:hypothetical protein